LDSQNIAAKDLAAVAVSRGPGSWTGLRIGVSAAKALAWGAGIQLVPVPSFEALALDIAHAAPGHARLSLRDARSEGMFVALFGETSPAAERWIEESVMKAPETVAAVEKELQARPGVELAVAGDRSPHSG
jgi:tRNA threonylcarbamoyladenosine biosynthesis protein TsaB